jgi:hypothetical protein
MIRTCGPASAVSDSHEFAIATEDLGCRTLEAGCSSPDPDYRAVSALEKGCAARLIVTRRSKNLPSIAPV